jgi:gamma-glutamyltranspeptidase/glutathione hydrolase
MVSTQLPIATETALRVLRDGGNAVDAAVAATFVQNVADYHQVSLFGAMTGLYYEAGTGKYYAFNAYGGRPLADRSPHGDPQKVSIAGKAKALEQLSTRFGTKPWASLVEPAISLAEEGVMMTSFMYAETPPVDDGPPEEIDPYQDDSNHNVIADAQGNWISYLHTGHGGMPGVFIDGVKATGSGRWQYTSGPGRRFSTHIAATFLAKDGKPWMALGSPGLPSQPLTEVLVNIIDFDMPPAEAVDVPRFWAYRDRGPSRDFGNLGYLEIESPLPDEVRKTLKARGILVKDLGPYNWHTGSIQIVWRDAAGKLHGVTDPRRLGHAAGF